MRLTLRTLLAYLDDVLEPSEAKEIGKKLQESPIATALVSRIREVMRRRRLGAPDLEGPAVGIDPNVVAQYLDNTLPSGEVGEVERICLESDVQLAEAAAAHQILTLALGEPVEISQSSRERLYVLGPVEPTQKLQAAGDGAARGNGAAAVKTPVSVKTVPGSAGPSFEETLPDYLRPKPWSGKVAMVIVGLLLLGAVWLGVISSDSSLREGWTKLTSPSAAKTETAEFSTEEPETQPVAAVSDIAKPGNKSETPPPPVKPNDQPEAPADAIVANSDEPAEPAPAPEPPAEPAKPVKPAKPEPAAEPAEVAVKAVPIHYISPDGVLLQLHQKDKSWYMVPRKSEVKPGALLACPEPFEAVLEFDQGALRMLILGGSVVEILKPNENASAAIQLVSGRIMLQTNRRDDKLWPFGMIVGPEVGVLEFSEGESLCGVEYLLKEPVGYEQPVPPKERIEGMYMQAGSVSWLTHAIPVRTANKGVYLNLLSDQPPLNFGPPSGSSPDWLDPQRRKIGSLLPRFAKQYEKEFELNQPIDSAMRALIRAQRPQISELAVRCLALTDNYQAVVQALAQTEYEDARKAAINGLRQWLGVRADRGPLLKQALETYYERPDQIDALYRLLWGFSVEDAKSLNKSVELVELLRSDKVEIRELAFANLVRLTGRKFDYRPLASFAQREPAVKRWHDHVIREGALIKKEE